MNLILNDQHISLLKTGRLCIQTPKTGEPVMRTIFYLDGDLVVFSDEIKLKDKPEIKSIHQQKIQQFVDETDKNLKRFETISAVIIFLLSWLSLFSEDIHFLVSVLSSSILGILLIFFKNIIGKTALKLVFKKLLS